MQGVIGMAGIYGVLVGMKRGSELLRGAGLCQV